MAALKTSHACPRPADWETLIDSDGQVTNYDIIRLELFIIFLTKNCQGTWDKSLNYADMFALEGSGSGVGNFLTYKREKTPTSGTGILTRV